MYIMHMISVYVGYNLPPSWMIFISTMPEGRVLINIIKRGGGLYSAFKLKHAEI